MLAEHHLEFEQAKAVHVPVPVRRVAGRARRRGAARRAEGATYSRATILVEQHQHSAVCEGDGRATEAALGFEPAAACTRLRENALTIGLAGST
jgi:hypothetical protein